MAVEATKPQAPEGFVEKDASSSPADHKPQPTLTKLVNVDNQIHNTTTAHEPPLHLPTNALLPPITTATSNSPPAALEHYMTTTATVSAHANLTDPLTTLFQVEKPTNKLVSYPPPTPSTLLPIVRNANLARLQSLIHTESSLLVECSNFATVAVWTPASHTPAPPPASFYTSLVSEGRHAFADFIRQIEDAREKHLYPVSNKFWHLSMMARDPRREYVAGAVRAVVEPFLKVAEREGVPVWLEAGSGRARDVYGHFGFETVDVIRVTGIESWCMIKR